METGLRIAKVWGIPIGCMPAGLSYLVWYRGHWLQVIFLKSTLGLRRPLYG